MGAEGGKHVLLMGLQVTDEATYASYRARMTPIECKPNRENVGC